MIQVLERNGSFSSLDEVSNLTIRSKTALLRLLGRRGRQHDVLENTDRLRVVKKKVSFGKEEIAVFETQRQRQQQRDDHSYLNDVMISYYSKMELNQISKQAQHLAESVAWEKNKHIVTCLHHCYGFDTKRKDLTTEEALNYYFKNQIVTDDNNGARTTLRGLERLLSSKIPDHRKQSIQAVLDLQAQLRQGSTTDTPTETTSMEQRLAQLSVLRSSQSRRFARLLAKGDAARAASIYQEG